MDFQEALKKYQDGTATDEEVVFVEDTVYDARALAKTRLRKDKTPEKVTFGQKIKRFFIKVVVVLFILVGLFGYGYFKVSSSAKENIYLTKAMAESNANTFILNELNMSINSTVKKLNYSRKLVASYPLERSYYLYVFTLQIDSKGTYVVEVDGYSGNITYYKAK